MTVTRVEFHNQRGQRLVGELHGTPNRVAAICCHGMLAYRGSTKHLMLAEMLAERGLATLRFDFAGRGESDGNLFDLSYSNNMEDLFAAIEFLAAGGVERLGLFGSSMGGAVALLAAAREERVVAVATLAAVARPELMAERHHVDVEQWRARGYLDTDEGRVGIGLYDDALSHDVCAAVAVLWAPILVLHGDCDTVVPPSDGHDIATAARNASLEMVLGADHTFSNPIHLRPAMRQVADFLTAELL
jgi:alpha-beta hydrolase superfamily lysophospholipase